MADKIQVLPRPQERQRKLKNAKPFCWSGGVPPTTERGQRRHAQREGVRKTHAEAIHQGVNIRPE
jgi:hypothetical protein